jgi:MFS superfamily sulfate permease-like transporter
MITAVSIFIVVLAQSAATSRAYANRYREPFDENVDLIGLGAANLAAGLSGTFVVNGSPTKTQIVDSAGGRSQIPGLVTSLIVLIVLVFLTGPLQYMPEAVLASVVLLIGIELVDVRGMTGIYRARLEEFWVAAITAAVVVGAGVEQGIILAMVLSVVIHLRHSYQPRNGVLTSIGQRAWAPVPEHGPAPQLLPGLVLYRFNASLYYANASRFAEDVRAITAPAEPPLSTLCIDAAGIDDIDYTGMETLRELITQAQRDGVTIIFAELSDNVRDQLARAGIIDLVGADAIYNRIREAVEAHGGTTATP